MAEENGQGSDPKEPTGDQPYKSFKTEQEFKAFESKTFSNGYNNYQSKALSRVGEVIGAEVSSLDDVVTHISDYKKKVSEQISDPTATEEYKQLQNNLKETKTKWEQAEAQRQKVLRQYDVDRNIDKGALSIKEGHKFNIPESDVKDLFNARFKTDSVDGRLIAKKFDDSINDYKPVTDDSGNYMPLDKVFAGFAKNYATPKAEGTGGESGSGGGGTGKVKRSEYSKALKENNDRASKLFAQAAEHGWIEDRDIPQ